MEENIDHFGLHNIQVIDHVDEETMKGCPVPSLVFMVASASMEQEIEYLTKLNPQISIVIYTLDFGVAASISGIFEKYGIKDTEVIQISVARLKQQKFFRAAAGTMDHYRKGRLLKNGESIIISV